MAGLYFPKLSAFLQISEIKINKCQIAVTEVEENLLYQLPGTMKFSSSQKIENDALMKIVNERFCRKIFLYRQVFNTYT